MNTRTFSLLNAPPGRAPEDVAAEIRALVEDFQAKNHGRLDKLEAELADTSAKLGRLRVGGGGAPEPGAQDRLNAFNALLKDRHGQGAPQLTASEFSDYRSALNSYLRGGQAALDRTDIRAALSVGSDPAGGFTVLPEVDPMPRERLFRTSPMRAVASQITISMGGSYEFPYDTGDFGHGWVGEQESRSETSETDFALHKIDAEEVYALVPLTQRLIDDSAIDMVTYVERRLQSKFRRAENTAFVSGNGVLKPRGFLDYPTSTDDDDTRSWGTLEYIPSGAAGDFPTVSGLNRAANVDALYTCKAALHSELRAGAVWAMNSTTLELLEKLKDEDGRPLIRTTLDEATPERLIGFPVVIMEDMPDPAADSFSIAFGNFDEGYQIVDKLGVRMLRDPYTTKGKVKLYAYKRVGGAVASFDAIKLIKFASS